MNVRPRFLLLAMVLVLAWATTLPAQEYAPNQVIVNGATPAQLAALGGVGVRAARMLGRGGDQLITLRPGISVPAAVALLEKLPNVRYASPNFIRRACATPTDPGYPNQWAWPQIQAPEAWDVTTGSSTITVGVVDTGVDLDHPDLVANIWVNQAEQNGTAGVDDDGNGYIDDIYGWNGITNGPDPDDDDAATPGHGTHVAGIIGAVANNGIGGVGANWNVKIMALKFLNAVGSGYDSDAIEVIDYAIATKNAGSADLRVLCNSWSGFGYNAALQAAIERARDAGIVFVAAAGNESYNIDSSGCVVAPGGLNVSNIVTVLATNDTDAKPTFSNFGKTLCELGAPGDLIYSTKNDGTYQNLSGTSMAAPHVAGVFALVAAVAPTLTVNQLIDRVMLNVDPVSSLDGITSTGGRLNAWRAVTNTPNPSYNSDRDGDWFPNHWDNCPYVANDQTDSDQDGIGDACPPQNTPCPGLGCVGSAAR